MEDKSLTELEDIYRELKLKLEETNKKSLRDKKYEFTIMPQTELAQILKSKTSQRKKKDILLSQIGYLRINLFGEYYEQIQQAQKENDLETAVSLMNKYAEIAIPFISAKKQPALIKWLRRLTSTKSADHTTHILSWKTGYESWVKHSKSIQSQAKNKTRMEEYNQLKTVFFTLYTYSFAIDNFPPLRNKRSDH